LDVINEKITQLDEVLQTYGSFGAFDVVSVVGDQSSSYNDFSKPVSSAKLKAKSLAKEREVKDTQQFAGIYTMKSVFYDKKHTIKAHSVPKEEIINKKPKLIELYQYPGFENIRINELPHDCNIDDILVKVLSSIEILKKQVTQLQSHLSS
jgi:hypothetical protein